jgi:hypothetical protein
MLNNQSSAATINEFPGLAGKGFSIRIQDRKRGRNTRTGENDHQMDQPIAV